MKKFTPQQQKAVDEACQISYERGKRNGFDEGVKKATEDYKARQNEMHLKALDSIARIGSALGQSIDAINRSMQCDRGYL